MALSQAALLDLLDALKASDGVDVIRPAVQVMLKELIEAEATARIGAERHERTDARAVQRIGHRPSAIGHRPSATSVVHHGRGSGVSDPETAVGLVLPEPAGAPPPDRSKAVRGGDGGLRDRHERAQGRCPGQGPRRGHRDLQVRGVTDMRRPGSRNHRIR